jgi:hypothetical protein
MMTARHRELGLGFDANAQLLETVVPVFATEDGLLAALRWGGEGARSPAVRYAALLAPR